MYGANKPSTLINDTRCELHFFRENPVRSATCMPKPNNILDFNQALTFNLEITELRRVKRRWSTVSAGAGRFRMERQLSQR